MSTVREAISAATAALAEAGIDSARVDAELLAAHVAGSDRGRLSLIDITDAAFRDRFTDAVRKRAQRIPLQHITGTAPFGPIEVHVGPGVFIPRPETESLLQWALDQDLPAEPVIVDLCTGSGALAVALATALANERPDATVIAVDDDPRALEYARRNASATQVRLIQADVTDPAALPELVGSVDLVVANPPYVLTGAELEPEVAKHDPPHALFGGEDGMAVIGPLVRRAAAWLRPGGLLAVEHDDTTSAATVETLSATGAFDDITSHRDLSGRPRFVTGRRVTARRGVCP